MVLHLQDKLCEMPKRHMWLIAQMINPVMATMGSGSVALWEVD